MCAAEAAVVWAVVHELVDDELSMSGEQVGQGFRAGRGVEHVPGVVELDHREPAATRGEHVKHADLHLAGTLGCRYGQPTALFSIAASYRPSSG